MEKLLYWLPDSFMPIAIIVIALGLMLGLIPIRRVGRLLMLIVLLLITGPFVDRLTGYLWHALPWWILLPLVALLVFTTLRFLAEMVLGERGTGLMIGILASDILRFVFRCLFRLFAIPFRILLHRQSGSKLKKGVVL